MSGSPYESITLEVEPPRTYRQSLLTASDACPYSAALYVRGQVPGHALYRGSVLHETFERATNTMREHDQDQMAPDDVKAIMEEVLRDHLDWVVPAREMDNMRIQVHHWATHFRLPPGALAEVPYTLEILGKTCTGTIDLLWVDGDTAYLRDYKSGYGLFSQDDVSSKDPETDLQRGARAAQLIQYALGVADGACDGFELPRGVNNFDLAYVFPLFATDEGMVERGVLVTRPELIEHRTWLEALVERTANAFEVQRFTAVPGSHCTRCPDSSACPIPARSKGTGPFEQDPVHAAEEWFRKSAEVARLFEELKGYAKVMGAVEFGRDMVLDFQQVESSKTPKKVKERVMAGEIVPPVEMYVRSVSTRFAAKKRAT